MGIGAYTTLIFRTRARSLARLPIYTPQTPNPKIPEPSTLSTLNPKTLPPPDPNPYSSLRRQLSKHGRCLTWVALGLGWMKDGEGLGGAQSAGCLGVQGLGSGLEVSEALQEGSPEDLSCCRGVPEVVLSV